CAASSTCELLASTATRSPGAAPIARKAPENRRHRSRNAAYVNFTPPSMMPVRSGNTRAARCRNAVGVSGSKLNSGRMPRLSRGARGSKCNITPNGYASMISGKTTLIAHLGYPTEAFKAPMIYNPYFEQAGIDAVVMPMGVRADDYAALLRPLFRLTNIRGALVTMPHKVTTV